MLDRIIRYLNIGKEDLVIDYSYDYRIYETILKLRKKEFLVACCPTEWFPKTSMRWILKSIHISMKFCVLSVI